MRAHTRSAQYSTKVTLPAFRAAKRPVAPAPSGTLSLRTETHDGRKIVAVLPLEKHGCEEDATSSMGSPKTSSMRCRWSKGCESALVALTSRSQNARDTGELGRALGVQVMVDGSLRRTGDTVRGHASPRQRRRRSPDLGEAIRASVGEVLRIGDEAATAIATALTSEREGGARTEITNDPVVVDLFCERARNIHRTWHDATTRSIELFARALELAPTIRKSCPPAITALALARRYAYESVQRSQDRSVQLAGTHARTLS